jgi:NitT/TauT family transport system substrate-binding protein
MVATAASAKDHNQRQLIKVSLRLDFFFSETHAGWFAAKDRGYFEKEGLDVDIRQGQGSGITVQQVAAGNEMFGWASATAMTQQVAQGADVIAVGSPRQVSDAGIGYWPDSGISQPRDLEGKTCLMTASGFTAILFPVWAAKIGLNLDRVNQRVLDAATTSSLFAAHRGDCIESSTAGIKRFAPVNGVRPAVFLYADDGVNAGGSAIIANSRQVRANPGLVTKFVRATLQGWIWACANPRRAVTLARTHFPPPAYDFDTGVELWKATCDLRQSEAAKGRPLGWMALSDWQNIVKLLQTSPQLGLTKNAPPPKTLFTNLFVDNAWAALKKSSKKSGAK